MIRIHIKYAALIAALAVNFNAFCLELNLTPGSLAETLGSGNKPAELVITGAVDVRDFDFMRSELTGSLTTLDLAGARIAAYNGEATFTGRTSAEADVLPEGALMLPSLTGIVLPSGLRGIADGALATTSITGISLPATLQTIGISAFAGCKQLTAIELPAALTTLGKGAFADCTALASAKMSATKLTALPDNCFAGCTALSSVLLPGGITEICNSAFNGCTALADFTFPASLTRIGTQAFYGSALKNADLGGTALTGIADWAFAGCKSLTNVALPESLGSIGKGAFYSDASLSLSQLPDIGQLSDLSFAGIKGYGNTTLTLPEYTEIGNYALSGWKGVQLLVLPQAISKIGDEAMAGWTDLTSIDATATVAVPALGNDVWAGIDKPSVLLQAPANLAPDYAEADQWKDFNIETISTGVENLPAATDGDIRVRFEGLTMHIEAPAEISGLEIYDTDGRRYTFTPVSAEPSHIAVDTSAWSMRIMLVRVALANGTAAALKLVR